MKIRIEQLETYNRPIMCTEYLARGQGSTFQAMLPLLKEKKIAAINWGFVAGKTNTIFPWSSWDEDFTSPPVYAILTSVIKFDCIESSGNC